MYRKYLRGELNSTVVERLNKGAHDTRETRPARCDAYRCDGCDAAGAEAGGAAGNAGKAAELAAGEAQGEVAAAAEAGSGRRAARARGPTARKTKQHYRHNQAHDSD